MKIEFKLPNEDHRATFQALTDMLAVLEREYSLSEKVCALMDADVEFLSEVVHDVYIQDGFQVEFVYFKDTGKISLTSQRIK